ncbi:MAG TPA: DUF485 domain-containing protein [Planctomycetaceae bacterium]|nr:DUF485 domain-containing protein [Planctomycetaceae bacterium]
MLSRNARIGLMLFVVYLLFYSGYVLINAISPQTMEQTPFAGVNLAIWYGMALIFGAFVLAAIYGLVCDPHDDQDASPQNGKGGGE